MVHIGLPEPIIKTIVSSPFNLTKPPTPPGFTSGVYLDTSKSLNPLAVLVVAIECMYNWVQDQWDSVTDGGNAYEDIYDVIIVADNSPQETTALQLKVSHIVLGLYEGLMDMLRANAYCELSVTLFLHQRPVGDLSMKVNNLQLGFNESAMVNGDEYYAALQGASSTNSSNILQGEYVDPTDPKLKISYTFHGRRISSKDIFTAALDGLANAAVFDAISHCKVLAGVTESTGCAIFVGAFQDQIMTYAQATKALKWMSSVIPVKEKNFGEMNVALLYDGQQIAGGYILKRTTPSNSIGDDASS